jgi:hypothetical protein
VPGEIARARIVVTVTGKGVNARRRPRIGWDADGNVELGPPILQFTIADFMSIVPDDVRALVGRTAAEHLDWLGHVMEQRGDLTGALLAALLVRHLIRGEDQDRALGFSPLNLYAMAGPIAQAAFPGIAGGGSVLGPVDDVLAHLQQLTSGTTQSDRAAQ